MKVGVNYYTATNPKVPLNIFHKQKGRLHLLLHSDKPHWLVVNDIGWEIAKLCDGRHDVNEIISFISAKYGTQPHIVYGDVDTYLNHLSRTNFLLNEITEGTKEQKVSLKRLHLNINETCNLRCIHCGVIDGSSKTEWIKKDKVFEIINELSEIKEAALAISGGEPLLHKDCLEILGYASKRLKTSLSTNATLIDEKTAQSLSSLDIDLQISLDGPDAALNDRIRGQDAFKRTLNGIRLLQRYGAKNRISLFVTVMQQNIDSIPGIIKFAEVLEIPSIRFLPIQKVGNARASWDNISPTPREYSHLYTYLYQKFPSTSIKIERGFQGFLLDIPGGQRWCHLGETLFIDSKGDIYPCSLMVHSDFHIGNIYEMSLKEAIESERLMDIVRICSIRESTILRCKECSWKNFCQASCPGSVFSQKGSLWDTDDLCDLRQKLYPEVIFDMAEKRMDISILKQSKECEI